MMCLLRQRGKKKEELEAERGGNKKLIPCVTVHFWEKGLYLMLNKIEIEDLLVN